MRCIVALRIEILDENRRNVAQQIAAHEFCKRLCFAPVKQPLKKGSQAALSKMS